MNELYRKYRPKKFKQMFGQEAAIKVLEGHVRKRTVPHFMLFTGNSGCGKTTAARILCTLLEADLNLDVFEENAAIDGGIDFVRKIRSRVGAAPYGKYRIWIIDECHQLTKAAQESFLKLLEDTPDWVYFIFCTTDPGKLIATIKSRSTQIQFKPVSSSDMSDLLDSIASRVKISISDEVKEKIFEVSGGAPRKALVLLNSIKHIKKEKDQLNAIQSQDAEKQAIDLCRLLMSNSPSWKEIASILKNITEEPETVRRIVLGYANTVALNSGMPKAFTIIDCFSQNYYDVGKAGLTWSCRQFLTSMGIKR